MKHLSKKQMWIFATGQLGWSLLGGIISAWLVTFYLPTKEDLAAGAGTYIQPGLVILGFLTIIGLITALCRVFDAVTDPLVASLSDSCKSKNGRRIPFMRIAAIPFSIVTVLVFCAPIDGISGWNVAWIAIFLVLFYTFMTLYCTPYNALISEFAKNQNERMYISTAISFTYLFGTLIAYLPFVCAGWLRDICGFSTSYRVCFILLATVACICMLLPAYLLDEKEFVESTPTKTNVFKSLTATFKNKDFRIFSGSDIMYWVGLTLFQTGLPFFVKVSMGFDEGMVIVFMGGMTLLSAVFYPLVTKLVKKFGKKKLVIAGFLGLAACYAIAAFSSIPGLLPDQGHANLLSWAFGLVIMVISAVPMALLGIIPQSIVADVAEAERTVTGESREGMFFAARTFAMKFGQSLAMLLFTTFALIGTSTAADANEIVPTKLGMLVVAIAAVSFCVLGAVILFFYREKKVMRTIAKAEDKEFLAAIENSKEPEDKGE